MKLPEKIYLSQADWLDILDCLETDFSQNPDATGSTDIHREYVMKDDGEFVPEQWGWKEGALWYRLEDSFILSATSYGFTIRAKHPIGVIYSGPLNPTLYRLIAEANGIPILDQDDI